MSSTKFIATLPQPIQAGDKIKISGQITDNAEEFSINFANEVNEDPQSIAYHFKWDLANKTIVEDYKNDNNWMDPKETQLDSFNGPEFTLEFSFSQDDICVYLTGEGDPNFITQFQPKIDFNCIQSVQVWGDVEKISQLTFSYN